MSYAELQVTSNFSFLRGASHPEELVQQAVKYGYNAIAVTDRNTVAGIVRAHAAAKKEGIRFIPACRLDLLDGPSLLAYPTNRQAWERLSELLTKGNIRTEKGKCDLYKQDVYEHAARMKFIAIPPASLNERFELGDSFKTAVKEYKAALGAHLYVAATRSYHADDAKKVLRSFPTGYTNGGHQRCVLPQRRLAGAARRRNLRARKCTIHTAGFKLHQNAERFLKPTREMHRLFMQYPDAIARTLKLQMRAVSHSMSWYMYIPKRSPLMAERPRRN